MLLAVMVMNYCVLMVNLGSLSKSCLGQDADYDFLNNTIKESKYCSDVVKKYFNTNLVMTK